MYGYVSTTYDPTQAIVSFNTAGSAVPLRVSLSDLRAGGDGRCPLEALVGFESHRSISGR